MRRVGTGVQGRVSVRFHVAPSGEVVDACLWDTDLQDGEFSSCILETYGGLHFEKSEAPTTVHYPIEFMPDR
jgi:hypothetical protein